MSDGTSSTSNRTPDDLVASICPVMSDAEKLALLWHLLEQAGGNAATLELRRWPSKKVHAEARRLFEASK